MPRRWRNATGGMVYHVLNRAVGLATLFESEADYAMFVRALEQAAERTPMRLTAWCIMPNHWHLLLWRIRSVNNLLNGPGVDVRKFSFWRRKQRGELLARHEWQLRECVAEPEPGVEFDQFAGGGEAVQCGQRLAAVVGAEEEPISAVMRSFA